MRAYRLAIYARIVLTYSAPTAWINYMTNTRFHITDLQHIPNENDSNNDNISRRFSGKMLGIDIQIYAEHNNKNKTTLINIWVDYPASYCEKTPDNNIQQHYITTRDMSSDIVYAHFPSIQFLPFLTTNDQQTRINILNDQLNYHSDPQWPIRLLHAQRIIHCYLQQHPEISVIHIIKPEDPIESLSYQHNNIQHAWKQTKKLAEWCNPNAITQQKNDHDEEISWNNIINLSEYFLNPYKKKIDTNATNDDLKRSIAYLRQHNAPNIDFLYPSLTDI